MNADVIVEGIWEYLYDNIKLNTCAYIFTEALNDIRDSDSRDRHHLIEVQITIALFQSYNSVCYESSWE
jgi:hypothetical protein